MILLYGCARLTGVAEARTAPSSRRRRRQAGRGMGRGYPPPQPTRGLGERRNLPKRGIDLGAFPVQFYAISHISEHYESCL